MSGGATALARPSADVPAADPKCALRELVAVIRADDTLISAHVGDPKRYGPRSLLAAAGPRAAAAPGEYALLFEAIREGYLLHYGNPRIIHGVDADLALLAGDYLYATGLERLAASATREAVGELSDLISLSAQVHAKGEEADQELAAALWLASAMVIASGRSDEHEAAKETAREGSVSAVTRLWQSALNAAALHSLGSERSEAARETIGFAAQNRG